MNNKKEILFKIAVLCAYIFTNFILSLFMYALLKQIRFNQWAIVFLCVICSHWLIGEVLKIVGVRK